MDVRFLILTLFFLVSCMPESQVTRGNLSGSTTTGGSTGGSTGGGSTAPITTKWNYLGTVSTSITINVSNLNNAYLVGTPVESYLSNSFNFTNANYCLVSSYTLGGVPLELRSRVVPISYYDFNEKRTVRVLRVDFQDVTNSSTICNGAIRVKDSNGDYVVDTSSPSGYKYDPSLLCPTCTSMLMATKVRLFQKGTSYLDEVPTNLIATSPLALQVDPNYSTGGGAGTCSNSDCQARGFDCCLDNQCVKDGATRPSASIQYPTLLQTAEAERLQNPLAYLNYPQLYYICGTYVPPTPTTSGGSTGGGYDEAFQKLKKDYRCVEHIKAQATTTPFHNELLSRSYTGTTDCLTASGDSSQEMYFQNVMKRLYTTCGCAKTDLSDMITSCPAYEYQVVTRDTLGEPTSIDCYTPPTNVPTVPAAQTVSLNSRSAPHRFFDSTGVEKVPTMTSTFVQEGDAFEYLDEGKVLPNQQNFSMNAILGPMSVLLDKTLPAKTVAVELDQVYFISTTSGYYTPCPSCAKDSWLSSFTAYPNTGFGVGLQAVGHTTERDAFSTNTTGGNYEDTIFGRACWLPPTMIPFSHSAKSSTQDQRLNRLQTQAALFINGYQRDWYGFNKGALIGSFDGVTWFAIGKGRIVKSTSKKLFLAINAPFADVASPTIHQVGIYAYDGITQAAQVDYDPQYHQSHPYQNEAGNCQKYHMCETDTDCVTKLGWEYACADIRDVKTNWPSFSSEAVEIAASSTSTTIDQILQQKRLPSSSSKRCVYRGAGALCIVNSGTISGTDLNKRKLMTCAPNFFCANVNQSGLFNSKVARYAAALEDIPVARNHLFGKDANVLGRPLSYVASGDTTSLPAGVRSTLIENMVSMEALGSSNTGLCQPGKALPTAANQATYGNPFNQHLTADSSRRADFISQIGSCNSTLFTSYRHSSCPVIGADGNYELFANATLSAGYNGRATNQNACGLESLAATANLGLSADNLLPYSPFRNIEAKPLNSQIITDPTMVRDACLRRAGAVCHTDLDCTPNKMHASQVDYFVTSFFGNEAEKSYYTEYLVCGQLEPKPLSSNTEAFKNYDMSKNRCCREIGSDLTTYTADIPTATQGAAYDAKSAGLKMSLQPGLAPNDAKRYSRLATVENLGTADRPILSAFQDRNGAGTITTSSQGANVMTPKQWRTLGEANSESCCGGGWIRKFSDGGNDWTRRDRVYMDVANFRCINSRTPLLTSSQDLAAEYNNATDVATLVAQDYGDYCKDRDGVAGSCAMFTITNSSTDTAPTYTVGNDYNTASINTLNSVHTGTNIDNFFKPRSADGDPAVIVDYGNTSGTARRNIVIKIPSFVSRRAFDDLYASNTLNIRLENSNGATTACAKDVAFNPAIPTTPYPGPGNCGYSYNPTSRVLKVAARAGVFASGRVGVAFDIQTAGAGLANINRTHPGTNSYYLRRLGRLELSGIPQITYEPLYCNDNSDRIVPGIFKSTIAKYNDFIPNNISFMSDVRRTNFKALLNEPVFSQNDFKCCTPLGKTVTSAAKCCSGFGVAQGESGTAYTCALPPGANLMVYFNRFVSNEGRGTEQPGGGLVDEDFSDLTGEPLLSATVNDKIRELGIAYCSTGKVRQGGAFGSFEPEPQGSETNLTQKMYNIVDSSNDSGQHSNAGKTETTGYAPFTDGFRWNHHLYCND
ncbi:hypothetical protein ACJVC5_17265 [Peredibacter sp. HCB2-198]|uniref:hypothetical protein n=1 Tax=Peredibacter sp. HCB2-198 TaxID=3383025 RepID=UPI0038B48B60